MINKEYDKKISAWLEQNRDRTVNEWMDLVRIPSIESTPEDGAPFGRECLRALETAADMYRSHGFSAELRGGNRYGLAEYGEGDKTICLFTHTDVVPVGDGWMYTQPFSPIVIDGTLIGRGVSDNKSGVIAALCAMSILKECGIPVNSRIATYLGSNEESGMNDIEMFVKEEKMPDLSIVPDADFPCCTGEKGILHMWISCDTPMSDVIGFEGGSAFNIILDCVSVTLKYSAKLEAEITEKIGGSNKFSIEKTADGNILFKAFGIAKHAAYPDGAENATANAAALLADCSALAASDRDAMAVLAKFFSTHYGEGLCIKHDDEDFGPLSAVNGMMKMEDGKLYASIDIRYGASFAPNELENALSKVLSENGWSSAWIENRPGFSTDKNSLIPGIMEDVYNEITGNNEKSYRLSGGTYARYLKNAFSVGVKAPCDSEPSKSLDMPAGHGGDHERDESIILDDFFRAVRILTHMIIECDNEINK